MENNTFDLQIKAPIAKVWNALTDTATFKAWMKNVQVETDWKQGAAIIYTCYDAAGKVVQWEGIDMIWKGTIETLEAQKEFTCVYPNGETGLLKESYLLKPEGDNQTHLRQVQTLTTAEVAAGYKEGTAHSLELLKKYLES